MLAVNAIKGLSTSRMVPRLAGCLSVRHKSSAGAKEPKEPRRDDFPYSRISSTQLEQLGAGLGHSQLPMYALFAQHRPLMPMPKPPVPSLQAEGGISGPVSEPVTEPVSATESLTGPDDVSDENILFVQVWQPERDTVGFHEVPHRSVPHDIAQRLGAFDVTVSPKNHTRSLMKGPLNRTVFPAEIRKSLGALAALLEPGRLSGPVQVQGANTIFRIEPESSEGDFETVSEIHATSVRRKRKLKMNRHKYRKRLKAQRTLRRRLGK